jgi:hypothetical protein
MAMLKRLQSQLEEAIVAAVERILNKYEIHLTVRFEPRNKSDETKTEG